MHSIPLIIAALLSVVSLVAGDEYMVTNSEPTTMTIMVEVRQEQVCRSNIAYPMDVWLTEPIQTLIFPHINAQESSGIDQERYKYVNSILSAVVPESELEEAQDNPSTYASTPLSERFWFEGLPTDVKEYLIHMAKAEARMSELDKTSILDTEKSAPRFRGKGWWWS